MKKNNRIVIALIIFPFLIPVGISTYYVLKRNQTHSSKVVYRKKPNPEMCEHPDGIDLSHHNIAYDWSKVDAKFVYIRATMGNRIKDKRYDIHRKAALRHNIPVGAYHFLEANTSAENQFKHFSSIVKKEHLSLRPMLDVEESDYWNAPKDFSDNDAHDFIKEWCGQDNLI